MLPKNIRLHLTLWIFIILSFIILAVYLIFRVSEYSINFKSRTIEKTTLLVIDSDPENAAVYLDDDPDSFVGNTPLELHYLYPKIYAIKIEKDGYKPYERTYDLKAGKYENVQATLFLKDIAISNSSETELKNDAMMGIEEVPKNILDGLNAGATDICLDKNKGKAIYKIGSELWLYQKDVAEKEQNQILARYLNNIFKVKFYSDFSHILFVIDNKLHIIELTGTNDTVLFLINQNDFWPSKDGSLIYFKEAGQVKKAKIR